MNALVKTIGKPLGTNITLRSRFYKLSRNSTVSKQNM